VVVPEFEIDSPNSVDKRRQEDFDRFGYSSLHYVASLGHSRAALADYSEFKQLKFEIQIRSILQHAWAEIEHDLQYKSELEIPREAKRRFARLAGLLDLADSEFTGLRDQIHRYRIRIEGEVKTGPATVLVDRDSLRELVHRPVSPF
jgi:putative GTP pyrophosphokinase